MNKNAGYQELLKKLSRDPRVKQMISKARRRRGKGAARNVETATGVFMLFSAMLSRFSKKKRARAIDDFADMVQLLVRVSLLLKENVFDRPEVKKFFRQRSRQAYRLAQEWLSMILPVRPFSSAADLRNRR